MKPAPNHPELPARAVEILGKLGLELAFVEPGLDTGLLPINSFVMDLEELAQAGAPPEIQQGLATARRWLDEILDGTGKFSPAAIPNFTGWHAWMNGALAAWARGAAIPAVPAGRYRPRRLASPRRFPRPPSPAWARPKNRRSG
jgi:hypothetical protein